MRLLLCLLLVLASFAFAQQQTRNAFIGIPPSLAQFQSADGGFRTFYPVDSPSTLEGTADALFLSSLFGIRNRFSSSNITRFVQSLENADHGYAAYHRQPRLSSDIESVRSAVLSFQHLGVSIPNAASLQSFVRNLYDPESGMYFSRVGDTNPSVRSTVSAIEVQNILLSDSFKQQPATITKQKDVLRRLQAADGHYEADNAARAAGLSALSANYFAVQLAIKNDDDVEWSRVIAWVSRQLNTGAPSLTAKDIAHGLLTLAAIDAAEGTQEAVNRVDLKFMRTLLEERAQVDLTQVALAYEALARTPMFSNLFYTQALYEPIDGAPVAETVVQGMQVRPGLIVRSFSGLPHPGLDVSVQINRAGVVLNEKLKWSDDAAHYVADEFIETNKVLGALSFDFVIRLYVHGLGERQFELKDTKHIGYAFDLEPTASHAAFGADIPVGSVVNVGTDFVFSLSLSNQTHRDIRTGDFDIVFSVLDSTDIVVARQRKSCRTNTAAHRFEYSLTQTNLPPGALSFRFQVETAGVGVHSTKFVKYRISAPLVASNYGFENARPEYHLGEKIVVFMEPATFPDHKSLQPLSTTDADDKNVASSRSFVMSVKSRGGVLLRTIYGKAASNSAPLRIRFDLQVDADFDLIGTLVFSFSLETASYDLIPMGVYDTSYGEIADDPQIVHAVVSAQLKVTLSDKPSGSEFFYGNEFSLRYTVKDAYSQVLLHDGKSEGAGSYMVLRNTVNGKQFTSVSARALNSAEDAGVFSLRYTISPNAVAGPGVLSLVAHDADGHELPLLVDNSEVALPVTIGGSIVPDAKSRMSAVTVASRRLVNLVVSFTLSCQEKQLFGADLSATLQSTAGAVVLSDLDVFANEQGVYQLSAVLDAADVSSGDFSLKVYRTVDVQRDEAAASPLFSLPLALSSSSAVKLPVRIEFLGVATLFGLFVYAHYSRSHLRAKRA